MLQRARKSLRQACRRPWRLLAVVSLLLTIGLGAALFGLHAWAGFHYWRAGRELERYRLVEARAHLESCLHVWPASFDVHLLAARTARRLDDYDAAERHLSRCQQLRGSLSEDVVLEQTLVRAQRGGMDSVMPYLKSLVEQNHPATPLILEAMARGYIRAFRFGDAAMLLALWQERRPGDKQASLLQGYVHEQIGPEQAAIENYRRVLEVDPEHDEARVRLADLLVERAMPAEALEHVQLLAARRPGDAYILVRLARCLYALGRPEEAEEIVDRIIAEQPRYRPALSLKGQLALTLNRPAEAERWLRESLTVDAADYYSQFSLARSLREQGKDEEALAAEVRLKVLEADAQRIRKIIQEDINRSPNDPAIRTEVGSILLRAGSDREGVQWLYSALRVDPTYPAAHRALAAHFDRIGEPQRAASHHRFLSGEPEPAMESGSAAQPAGRAAKGGR